jgi:carboxyl-terminal processing protease
MFNFVKKNSVFLGSVLVVFSIIFFVGFYAGRHSVEEQQKVQGLLNMTDEKDSSVDFASFWKAWNIINEKYLPETATSTVKNQDKVYGAISGLVYSLGDPHSVFFPPVESKDFADSVSGSFEGVGMEVDIKEGILTVIAPLKNTPAYKAGIKAGDKILKINDRIIENIKTEDAIKLIKGKKGTKVTFTILRKDIEKPFEVSVIRDVIDIPTIETDTKGDVFIIRLFSFTATSPNLFRNALREFVESGKTKLVLDLRGNPGGYLESAVDIASWFLPAGKVVVVEESKNKDENKDFRSRGYNIFNENLKMAILIDGGSASASEILSGALSEYKKAILVGTKSYGKGSVQELLPITDDTSIKITVARWLTPNGHSISKGGLTPDVLVEFDSEKFKKGEDVQLNKAIEELNK